MMQELGLELPGPTVIYEDNSPSISIIEGERSMAATTRSLEINLWKLRERSDMQLVELVFCRTYDQLADNFTKANPVLHQKSPIYTISDLPCSFVGGLFSAMPLGHELS